MALVAEEKGRPLLSYILLQEILELQDAEEERMKDNRGNRHKLHPIRSLANPITTELQTNETTTIPTFLHQEQAVWSIWDSYNTV